MPEITQIVAFMPKCLTLQRLAMLQGRYRLTRANQYMKYLDGLYGYPVHKMHTIPGVGHTATAMFGSDIGLYELFGP